MKIPFSPFPLFPPVDPPLNLEIDQTLVEAKQEFRALIQNSEYFCREEKGFCIERYTNRYKSRTRNLELGKAVEQVLLPLELRSRKRPKILTKRGADKKVDLEERLKEWEKKDEGLQTSKRETADSEGEEDDVDDETEEKKLAEQQRREKEMESDNSSIGWGGVTEHFRAPYSNIAIRCSYSISVEQFHGQSSVSHSSFFVD